GPAVHREGKTERRGEHRGRGGGTSFVRAVFRRVLTGHRQLVQRPLRDHLAAWRQHAEQIALARRLAQLLFRSASRAEEIADDGRLERAPERRRRWNCEDGASHTRLRRTFPFPRTTFLLFRTPRSAWLTAASEGKASAISGSSRARLLPSFRNRATYLPRTPPFMDAKSYSGFSSSSCVRLALLIEFSLAP